MRVIAGIYKSRLLKFPKSQDVRPTQDRIKESMFEIIKPYLAGSDVLELFSGSGSLGIEALSRGAQSVVFVERDPLCINTIEENLSALKINVGAGLKPAPTSVIKADVFKALRRFAENKDKFGIIIADPPYGWAHQKKLLIKLSECDILKQPHLVIIEHSRKSIMPNVADLKASHRHAEAVPQKYTTFGIPNKEGNIILYKQYNYGDTVLSIYRKEAAS